MKFPEFDAATVLVIFGATGDLSRKKLLPALFDMYRRDYLPTQFQIVGFSRRAMSDAEFQQYVFDTLKDKADKHDSEIIQKFVQLFHYQQGDFDSLESYKNLSTHLKEVDMQMGLCSNKLFYLAVPPTSYRSIFVHLHDSELTVPCSDVVGWTRVLVEKPFGRDLETAQELDTLLSNSFQEKQIFRIDHYLAKETIQDILTFRFSNTIFEPIWNNEWIEKVEIKLWEDIDIAARGVLYDDIGALRDVGQNHMLQMLALIAMNHPGAVTADAIRQARVDVIRSLKLFDDDMAVSVIRGQYEGFVQSEGVMDDSETETYFRLKTQIDNERWRGVPFYLESGKALKDKKVEIIVTFKGPKQCFCPASHGEHVHQNTVTFTVQPQEKITVRFWSKKPGMVADMSAQDLSFDYATKEGDDTRIDAYERVLFDCIAGDQTLFASTDEVRSSWEFITPILNSWQAVPLLPYVKGSAGPKVEL